MVDPKKPRKERRHFSAEFKTQAVQMWRRGEKSMEQIARELGISVYSLRDWSERDGQAAPVAGPNVHHASREELAAEVERLKRELARITDQRDILKKAAGILSEPPQSGMPGLKR